LRPAEEARQREIGTRILLARAPGQVMGAILTKKWLWWPSLWRRGRHAFAASRLTAGLPATMLFGVRTRDVGTYLAVVAGMAGVGLAANYVPARRAAAIEPAGAPRAESTVGRSAGPGQAGPKFRGRRCAFRHV